MVTVHQGFVFGGPMNEQYVAAEGQTLKAVMPVGPVKVDWSAASPFEAVPYREVLYHWERFAFHNDHWGCWVAEGYPRHRITDALNMILSLSRLMTGM